MGVDLSYGRVFVAQALACEYQLVGTEPSTYGICVQRHIRWTQESAPTKQGNIHVPIVPNFYATSSLYCLCSPAALNSISARFSMVARMMSLRESDPTSR